MRYIDADELLNQYPEDKQSEFSLIPLYEVRNSIKRAPTVDTVKRGHWIFRTDRNFYGMFKCSVCRDTVPTPSRYCPMCGAKMD